MAALLDHDNTFIPKILRRTFSLTPTGHQVDVLAAVVDRIPFPSESEIDQLGFSHGSLAHGSEGVSIYIAPSKDAAPDLWSASALAQEPSKKRWADRQHTVTLVLRPSRARLRQQARQNKAVPHLIYKIQLPLASTLFQNGLASTMSAQCWKAVNIQKGNHGWTRIRHLPLEHQELQLDSLRFPDAAIEFQGFFPFVRLTPPRIVADSMGNIVRRLQIGDSPDQTATASRELEDQINGRSKQNSEVIYHSEVWAEVIPREIWRAQPKKPLDLGEAVTHGHHFHKVLSGGGGWGNRRGLISLDPKSSFDSPAEDVQSKFGDELDFQAERREALGEVVRPGDVVSFYALSQKFKPVNRLYQKSDKDGPSPKDIYVRSQILFGAALAEGDERAPLLNGLPPDGPEPEYIILRNFFGALSETGVSVSIDLVPPAKSTKFGAQEIGRIVETKLPPLAVCRSTKREDIQPYVRKVRDSSLLPGSISGRKPPKQEEKAESTSGAYIKQPRPVSSPAFSLATSSSRGAKTIVPTTPATGRIASELRKRARKRARSLSDERSAGPRPPKGKAQRAVTELGAQIDREVEASPEQGDSYPGVLSSTTEQSSSVDKEAQLESSRKQSHSSFSLGYHFSEGETEGKGGEAASQGKKAGRRVLSLPRNPEDTKNEARTSSESARARQRQRRSLWMKSMQKSPLIRENMVEAALMEGSQDSVTGNTTRTNSDGISAREQTSQRIHDVQNPRPQTSLRSSRYSVGGPGRQPLRIRRHWSRPSLYDVSRTVSLSICQEDKSSQADSPNRSRALPHRGRYD